MALPLVPLSADLRLAATYQSLGDDWERMSVHPRGSTLLGISFRPLQTAAFGLRVRPTLARLLQYPIQIVRLGAYWSQIEVAPGVFDTSELDWQIDAVEQAGASIFLCVGALKTFGFPEYHIPAWYLTRPFPDGALVTPQAYPDLLKHASDFICHIVDRYKNRTAIVGWQLENEPLEPLTFAHYWRLSKDFLLRELEMLRGCDTTHPIMINGYMPTALSVRIGQTWLTRDQGDSLTLAKDIAHFIGIDYYPRIGIASAGPETLYLNSTATPWGDGDRDSLSAWARAHAQRLVVAESESEPWEVTTVPPSPLHRAPYSCTPGDIVSNYNWWAAWAAHHPLYAYLFWGAEYWVMRGLAGDQQYLRAFARILENT